MKISVAICMHNGERFIVEQLNSILNQTITPDEIIICDDASSDRTLELISGVIKNEIRVHFKIIRNPSPLKTIKNFELAISLAKGDLIFLSDQDDIWYPHKVKTMVEFMSQRPELYLVFSNADLIDGNGLEKNETLWSALGFTEKKQEQWLNNRIAFLRLLKNDNYVTGATVVFRKKLKNYTLPINVPKGYFHDAWLALHAAGMSRLGFINKSLIKYRLHPAQQVGIIGNSQNPYGINNSHTTIHAFKRRQLRKYPLILLSEKFKSLFLR